MNPCVCRFVQLSLLLLVPLISGCASVQRAVLDANTSTAAATGRDPTVITGTTVPVPAAERPPQTTARVAVRPEIPPRQSGCDRSKAVSVGMTVAEVYASCWGKPKSTSSSVLGSIKTDMLMYEGYNYVYVENGIVKSIETSGR